MRRLAAALALALTGCVSINPHWYRRNGPQAGIAPSARPV